MADIIMAEAPVALGYERYADHVTVYPLTVCCRATGKGCDGYVGCRSCYAEVDPSYGSCWEADGRDPLLRHGSKWASPTYDGWAMYRRLVMDEGVDDDKADELVAEAKRQAAAL
jgi:hypothetical protein